VQEGTPGVDYGRGGGLWLQGPTLSASELYVIDNTASTEGGGVYRHGGDITITSGCMVNNSDLAFFADAGTHTADGIWGGHPTGPGPPVGSGQGDTASSGITVNSFLATPPARLICDSSMEYDCSQATLTGGAEPSSYDISFTTTETGSSVLAFTGGTDVTFGGFSPPGCESDGSTTPCVASITVTNPGSLDTEAFFVIRTPVEGPSSCSFTNDDGMPVVLRSFEMR